MASTLRQVIFQEGAALYRDIREWRFRWREELQGVETRERGRAGPRGSAGSKGLSSPLHVYYPFLFHSLFEEIPIETVRELALADRLYTEHLLSYDRILDQADPPRPDALFLAHLEQMQSLRRLYGRFPVGHPFWDYFRQCYDETWRSVRCERLFHAHRIAPYPLARFCAVAKGKTAVLKPFSLALAFLARRTEELESLSASLDQHHIALVLVDDLEDWRQDFERSNFTFLLTRLIRKTGLVGEIRRGGPVSPERIGRLLYGTGRMERQLRLAEGFFQKAVETVDALPVPLWKDFNEGFRFRCRALRHDLAEIRRREIGRVRANGVPTKFASDNGNTCFSHPAAGALRPGLSFLLASAMRQEAFPLSASPHAYMHPAQSVAASRFVTTLVARSLGPLRGLDPAVPKLLSRLAVWLNEAHGTAPDPRLPAALERAVATVPLNRKQIVALDRSFAPGHGPLPDGLFWANLLYSCARKGFSPPRLASFVTDCLLRGFYVPWSHGVSFGPVPFPWTRHACRPLLPLVLLCPAVTQEVPRRTLQRYLLAPHRAASSWYSPTETALTLLCLLETEYDGPEVPSAIERLTGSQERDGSWPANAVYKEENAYYGSRELTTAWCLEALLRYLERGPKRERAVRDARPSALSDTDG